MRVALLFSGGLDSTAAMFCLLENGHTVCPITLDYGQKASMEISSAADIARYASTRLVVETLLGEFPRCPLTRGPVDPKVVSSVMDEAPLDYVPGLLPTLLSIGIKHALREDCNRVCLGLSMSGSLSFPDVNDDVIMAMNIMALQSSHNNIRLLLPLWKTSKAIIVKMLAVANLPYWMTYSCISGDEHCGTCHKCVLRKYAFSNSHSNDPTEYGY